ncbi:MAG: RluA family pseudouridine synthase [Planctomycetes bacterium]|nr:RluA family pseudouridine synthase [Planctomycetota bacterium]
MNKPYSVVYENEHILVVDKPSGLLVIPTPAEEVNTLTGLLNRDFAERGLAAKVHPCHRLDRETSGLIVYAKGKGTQQKIMDQFHNNQVTKRYICFVQGYFGRKAANREGTMKYPLEGRPAITGYRILKYYPAGFTMVEAEPLTGRTNQIRLHFKISGHPIVGERKFAVARAYGVKFRRLALHSSYISFYHPVTGQKMEFKSDLPPDMARFIETTD